MLLYDKDLKYNYSIFGKADMPKQLRCIYSMINQYGDEDFSDVYPESGNMFDISLHYLPDSFMYYNKKIVAVEVTTALVGIGIHKFQFTLQKKSMSYHKSFKHLNSNQNDLDSIIANQGLLLAKSMYIQYIPIKLGSIKLWRFKNKWRMM